MLYSEQNDETLVMLTLAGEQNAYEILVARYEKAVISAAASSVHNRFMAEDAAQDAFVTAWMKLNLLREPDKFGIWVCRIAKNCARNMIARYRSYLSLDELENCMAEDDREQNPQTLYTAYEDKAVLHKSISRLPEKVREIIRLHYFEGLSVAEIACRMQVAEGTVKWQLNNGRKKLRKELCSVNEEMNDTLIRRVMKKVEELKAWQRKNSKNGFECVYRDVLRDVEELPESADKYCALADVLMRGYWWIPGEKNDALFARIKEAAELGRNEEVMRFICSREDNKAYGGKLEFIRDRQIPKLEKEGLVKTLGSEWFWLGYEYLYRNEQEKCTEAFGKAISILPRSDIYFAYAEAALEQAQDYFSNYVNLSKKSAAYRLCAAAGELRIINGIPCRYSDEQSLLGQFYSTSDEADKIFRNASFCDGYFTKDGLAPGETHTGTDSTTLTFEKNGVTVETPAGIFENCQLWTVRHDDKTFMTYYKSGVGIVKQEQFDGIAREERVLISYRIVGGEGLIPLAAGNCWEYSAGYNPEALLHKSEIRISYADGEKVTFAQTYSYERLKYDDNVWIDMIRQIRNEYWDVDNCKCCDVSYPIERAKLLAKTPFEKAYTKAATAVARRILDTNPAFNPGYTESGAWNFFYATKAVRKDTKTVLAENPLYSFELKFIEGDFSEEPLFYNNVYKILQFNLNCIMSDEWKAGKTFTEESIFWGELPIKAQASIEAAGEITTAAGTFGNCIKLSIDTSGFDEGITYIGGKKEYYFAEGVGIVRTVNHYCNDTAEAVYELTSYEGTGKGYMPIEDGMMRHYDALDMSDGYTASAEYTYAANGDGDIFIFHNLTGVKKRQEKITQYSTVYGEIIEDELWEQGKHVESRLRHDINNFNIMCHFLYRPNRYWAAPEKAAAWNKYRMQIIESFGGGEVPRAWLGFYSSTCFRTACALFGCGKNDEGYEYLERAFQLYPEWDKIQPGELLEAGDETLFGGIKIEKGKCIIVLPDGTKEPIVSCRWIFDENDVGDLVYYGMTATSGWEWFNGVRNEERFKEYIERARSSMKN